MLFPILASSVDATAPCVQDHGVKSCFVAATLKKHFTAGNQIDSAKITRSRSGPPGLLHDALPQCLAAPCRGRYKPPRSK
jgi:hypothetical protein